MHGHQMIDYVMMLQTKIFSFYHFFRLINLGVQFLQFITTY